MKIAVLGGSPKGETSVTMQYVRFLELNFPEHVFTVHQPAHLISLLENDSSKFQKIMEDVEQSNLVLWAFPLYYMTCCSQYLRFLHMIVELGKGEVFKGKYALALTTSIRYFDHTALRFIREYSEDLGMRYLDGYSAHMNDLHNPVFRKDVLSFYEAAFSDVESGVQVFRETPPLHYQPSVLAEESGNRLKISTGKRVLILQDGAEGNVGILSDQVAAQFDSPVERIDLRKVDIKGGCLGCLRCGQENRCAYEGKDGYIDMYRNEVQKADIIFFILPMVGRAFSPHWKRYLDRSFFNTHQRSILGKQVAFLVSGPLKQCHNSLETLYAYMDWQRAEMSGVVTDEDEDASVLIPDLVRKTVRNAEKEIRKGVTFLGYAGMKVFRDDVYAGLRVIFKGDFRNYRKTGVFDFPQKNPLMLFGIFLFYWVTRIPFVYKRMFRNFKGLMIMQYQYLLKKRVREKAM